MKKALEHDWLIASFTVIAGSLIALMIGIFIVYLSGHTSALATVGLLEVLFAVLIGVWGFFQRRSQALIRQV